MKKILAGGIALIYFALSNYCIAYAMLTGRPHHPNASETQFNENSHHEHGHNDADHHHDAQDSHDHGSSKNFKDTCCTNFKDIGPALVSAKVSIRLAAACLPFLSGSFAFDSFGAPLPDARILSGQGPPRSPPQEVFLSNLSPRSPPYSANL
ncbi:MAG: hypothetical protein HY547_05035 [Elusimicrobia bacterium]|nr:hypothetical protein [Elusimicrobiota bacterium]